MSDPKRFLLWISQLSGPDSRLGRPDCILTAADPAEYRAWVQAHPWCESIPMLVFLGESEATDGEPFQGPPAPGEWCPWRVRGADVESVPWYGLLGRSSDRMAAASKAATDLTRVLRERLRRRPLVWEICAHASGGLLAAGAAAAADGSAIAIGKGGASALTAAACEVNGIHLSSRPTEVKPLPNTKRAVAKCAKARRIWGMDAED